MKKKLVLVLVAALVLAMMSGCKEEETEQTKSPSLETKATVEESSSKVDPFATEGSEEIPTEPQPTEPQPTEPEPTEPEPETQKAYSDPYNGVLQNSGFYQNVTSLPNKSVPYGNDWEDKDATGLSNGIHWYEAVYGKYNGVYRIKTDQKLIYLTFDEGYEAGYTPAILDTLKANHVKAVFFVTKQFVDQAPELVQRMIDEGHVVGNHTCLHPSGGFPRYVDQNGIDSFINDVSKLHKIVYDKFGYTMRLFRFPEGESSEMLLAQAWNMGYASVFWSYAHYDYNRSKQPEVSVTLDRCMNHMAPGAVYLLHACSSSNTEALNDFIKGARAQGYDFALIPVDAVTP